ncbi:UNVERIFIED_CONTAM: hypothetical protein GTU68_027401, partial [Idotea baltica]|nr:hypothetical protein [Idotea baltica]
MQLSCQTRLRFRFQAVFTTLFHFGVNLTRFGNVAFTHATFVGRFQCCFVLLQLCLASVGRNATLRLVTVGRRQCQIPLPVPEISSRDVRLPELCSIESFKRNNLNQSNWDPSSWTKKSVLQQPTYDDSAQLDSVLQKLGDQPPLVTNWEIERLKGQLADAASGKAFLLQGGDCCESFDDCRSDRIEAKLKLLLQMSLVMIHGLQKPVIRVGRIAGQYAKPRSSDDETRGDLTLPSYRGDIVNSLGFDPESRRNRPKLMLQAYANSVASLNYLRALTEGGFADLHHPDLWELDFVSRSSRADEYHQMVQGIDRSLRFLDSIGAASDDDLSRVDFYTSHEAL